MPDAVPDDLAPDGPNPAEDAAGDAANPQDALDRATFINVFVQGPRWSLIDKLIN